MTRALRAVTRLLARQPREGKAPTKRVAIVIPLSTRAILEPDECVSIRHLRRYLGQYDKYLLAPRGLKTEIPDCKVKFFSRKYFGSAAAHARMLYDPAFYRAFEDYEFIFFYHLDSLVFSDQMEYWCNREIDYIGAPWIPSDDTPWVRKARVGNCGFALLRVSAALEVLHRRYIMEPSTYWLDMFTRNCSRYPGVIDLLCKFSACFPRVSWPAVALEEWKRMENPGAYSRNTDMFWSDRAVEYLPEFRVASLEDGLKFAFEAAPSTCLRMNGGKLPFGCHAWGKYDRGFWEPHLLPDDGSMQAI